MRQVNEPLRISSSKADMLLNSKNEFHQASLARLVAFMWLEGDHMRVFPRARRRRRQQQWAWQRPWRIQMGRTTPD